MNKKQSWIAVAVASLVFVALLLAYGKANGDFAGSFQVQATASGFLKPPFSGSASWISSIFDHVAPKYYSGEIQAERQQIVDYNGNVYPLPTSVQSGDGHNDVDTLRR